MNRLLQTKLTAGKTPRCDENKMMNRPVILCIDDERTILDALKIELKRAFSGQYLIETVQGGEEALELVDELLEDNYELPLVICDYMMHDIKGDELLKRIHLISPNTLKVMLTGQTDISVVANAINSAKLYRYIAKPWDKEDLILTVREAIKSYFKDKQLAKKNKELEIKATTFHKFVPVQFIKLLNLENCDQIELGRCVEKTMTIMFSDIRGFTSLSEKMTPQDNFNFINDYLSQMEPIINKYQGFIDKYMGDGIMALFPTSADNAVQGAIAMLKQLVKSNQRWQSKGLQPIKIGIGLHTGPLMLGTVGGQNRMDGTVISDAVNLASRVEGLTKNYGTSLLITEQTYLKLAEPLQYHIRVIDAVKVKGKSEVVTIYEIYDAESPPILALKDQTRDDFEEGFVLYHWEEYQDAQPFFEKVLQINEKDEVARIYLERCQQILSMKMPQSPRILIVDDTLFDVQALSYILTKKHFEVSIADNGKTALTMAQHNRPHLILLDVMMPGMDGFETCRRLKAEPQTQNIPVIFMTALADTADKVKGFQAGAVDYITKPFQPEEVLARIKTHLRLSHLQNQSRLINLININHLEIKAKLDYIITNGCA
jgi:DNA-binding response OmpR family regulator/class 3 adenylate cyclase